LLRVKDISGPVRGSLGRMRRPLRGRGHAWRHRRARSEILGVEAARGHAPAREIGDETAHKLGRTANVKLRVAWDAQFVEHVHAHAPDPVEIDSGPIGWLWRTVTNVAAASGQGLEELAHLRRKWMLAAVRLRRIALKGGPLGAIHRPTLVLVGNEDELTPVSVALTIADGIAGSKVDILQDCGHLSTMERPDAVTEALRAWISR
jgi:pimeloyl-ACP methyl ester carboxylesterase